jgi:glycosyltransferase involved in cell wall biosynthesis
MNDVTVLMPVYNAERHVRAAIDSILGQTHRDFELLIVDDGSTDRSPDLVSSYRDSRIRLVVFDRNRGLSAALNEGLRLARFSLIARQDADDLSEPHRLAQQVATMMARADLALLGSQAVAIAEDGTPTGTVRRPISPGATAWFSMFDNPFIHTSVVFRTEVVRGLGGFNAAYDPFSQDYDVWCRIMTEHAVANLPEALVRYRVNDASIIGALDPDSPASDYQRRFDGMMRELTVRQLGRVLGPDAIGEAEAPLMAGLVLGLDRSALSLFLSMFERLLVRYRDQCLDCDSADFRLTLARQFDALAFHMKPATRGTALAIYVHVLRHHAALVTSLSWPRVLAALLLGGAGRKRLARWKRRHPVMAKG